jgi:hypothetical protein
MEYIQLGITKKNVSKITLGCRKIDGDLNEGFTNYVIFKI